MGFISFCMGAFLVSQAYAGIGIGGAALMLVLWVLFGHFLGVPPCIGVLASYSLWDEDEAFQVLFVQSFLWIGSMWLLDKVGLSDLFPWFCIASGINGLFMVPAMIKEKTDQKNSKQE